MDNKKSKKHIGLLIILSLAILTQLFKNVSVYKGICFNTDENEWVKWAYSIACMLVVEGAVVSLVFFKERVLTIIFSLSSVAIGFYYFHQINIEKGGEFQISLFCITTLFSILTPLIIWRLSELYMEHSDNEDDYQNLLKQIEELLSDKQELESDNQKLLTDKQILENDKQRLSNDIKRLSDENQTLKGNSLKLEGDNQKLLVDNQKLLVDNQELESDKQRLSDDNQELKANSDKWIEAITCEHCGKVSDNPIAGYSHEQRCAKEKKKKEKEDTEDSKEKEDEKE